MTYQEFIASKRKLHKGSGVAATSIHPRLFDFQKSVVSWALSKGSACVFAGTGLGKTTMQVEIMRQCSGSRLIVAPLAVAGQTVIEGATMGVDIHRVLHPDQFVPGAINIVNYDRLESLNDHAIDAIALDESSILKSHDGKFRQYVTERFKHTLMRFAFTATPSPNDYMELGTHAEFVGASTRAEMLATYFMHDGGDTAIWRLKRHARRDFWKWVSSWACVFGHPSDIGFDQDGYDLPELNVIEHVINEGDSYGGLFGGEDSVNATNLYKGLRDTCDERVEMVRGIVAKNPSAAWLIWCNTDSEQDALENSFPSFASVRGSMSADAKEDGLLGFASGKYRSLITKPKIAGFGMNWQQCHDMVFCGVTYSFEQMYQAIRRCYRFGQTMPVNVHLVTHGGHEGVRASLKAKEEAFKSMNEEMRQWCHQEVSR